jgi:hypothetical protein
VGGGARQARWGILFSGRSSSRTPSSSDASRSSGARAAGAVDPLLSSATPSSRGGALQPLLEPPACNGGASFSSLLSASSLPPLCLLSASSLPPLFLLSSSSLPPLFLLQPLLEPPVLRADEASSSASPASSRGIVTPRRRQRPRLLRGVVGSSPPALSTRTGVVSSTSGPAHCAGIRRASPACAADSGRRLGPARGAQPHTSRVRAAVAAAAEHGGPWWVLPARRSRYDASRASLVTLRGVACIAGHVTRRRVPRWSRYEASRASLASQNQGIRVLRRGSRLSLELVIAENRTGQR